MPLYLCTHAVEPSASVPLPMIVLIDLVRRKQLPLSLRPRMVLPTSGATSVSVWDAPSAASLEAWLNEHLNQDVVHELNEVQEDFSHGIAFELSRARTADRVAANSKSTLQKLSQTASKAGDGFHRQLEALELGGSGASFLGAAESALARFRGPAATPTSSALSASSLGAQDAADGTQASRASSYYSWLQSKVKGTGLFANHPSPRAAPPSTLTSAPPPTGLDMGLEAGAASGMGLDAAAVAASTGPLPPSYTAATSAPSWEEDEPFVIGNDVSDDGYGGIGGAYGGTKGGSGAAEGSSPAGRGWEGGQAQQDVQQQDVQQQQQKQEQKQQVQQEQQGVDQVLRLEENSSADQTNLQQQQQQQQQQSVGAPDRDSTVASGASSVNGAAGQEQQQQQQQQQQQLSGADKPPMFILGDDDDDNDGGQN